MTKHDLLETAEAVAGLIPRLARGLTSTERSPADDLPLAQLRLCAVLFNESKRLNDGPRPMSALSRELGVSLSALTQIADRLERARLVKRVVEESDRRVRCLQLTDLGDRMMRKRREARLHRTLAVLERLSSPQRDSVQASLEILANACAAVHAAGENGGARGKAANGRINNRNHAPLANKNSK